MSTSDAGGPPPLSWAARVAVWDRALAGARAVMREAGMREVSTATRVEAVALEPWIEPLTSGGALLATSPELAMKRLLARGVGSIFQIAHVFRAGERGALHREEFHLLEWYRDQAGAGYSGEQAMAPAIADVERVVEVVFDAVAEVVPGARRAAPWRWRRVGLLEIMAQTLGVALAGDEPAEFLEPILIAVREAAGVRWTPRAPAPRDDPGPDPERDPELAAMRAWIELFSLWSDLHLDPWLASLDGDGDVGVHVVGFPARLAALAELEPGGRVARRFETHVCGVELANGYVELRDAVEQRRRFELVAALRADAGLPALPMPEGFLADLERLPACAGVALGLDRLIALACGGRRLDEVALVF